MSGGEARVRVPPLPCLYPGEFLLQQSRKARRPLDSEGLREGQVVVVGVLALQQVSVGGNLLLQPGLDVHEVLVLLVLPLGVSSHVTQLGFDTTDQRLDLRQLGSKASLRFCQRAFQGGFLKAEREEGSAEPSAQKGSRQSHHPGCPRLQGHKCESHRTEGTYHAELRLQLNLQTLEGAPQVSDLRLADLQLLRVASDLPVQLLGLQ